MRALVQRVSRAAVRVDGEVIGQIGRGLVVLLGVRNGDSPDEAENLADKCANLRIFTDDDGKFNLSLLDVGGEALVVSHFTLYGDTRRGRRPSFVEAAPPPVSEPLYERFVAELKSKQVKVQTGQFGAMMEVELINDGPVTVMVEREGDR